MMPNFARNLSRMRPALLGLAALCPLALAACPAAAGDTLVYVAGSGGEFGTLDLTGGASFGRFAPTGIGLGATPDGLGYGSDGRLYGVEGHHGTFFGPGGTFVYGIDPSAGAITTAANITGPVSDSAAASGGAFYNLTPNYGPGGSTTLFTLDPTVPSEGSATYSVPITVDGVLGVNGSTLYVADYGGSATSNDELYSVNTATGAQTAVGDTGEGEYFDFYSGVYADGTLYGFGTDDNIYTINTTTGAVMLDGSYDISTFQQTGYTFNNGDYITATAVVPNASAAPEPSETAMLSLLGLGVLGLIVRRRVGQRARSGGG